MTRIAGNVMRAVSEGDSVPRPVAITLKGYALAPRETKVLEASGAPVFFYDVVAEDGTRAGSCSAALAAEGDVIEEFGHVWIYLAQGFLSARLLETIGQELIRVVQEHGVKRVRLVVKAEEAEALEGCRSIGAVPLEVRRRDGGELRVFEAPELRSVALTGT